MLLTNNSVDRQGNYTRHGGADSKVAYLTMMQVRAAVNFIRPRTCNHAVCTVSVPHY
jgi:hypothetical protein